jgi:hypothetical protein
MVTREQIVEFVRLTRDAAALREIEDEARWRRKFLNGQRAEQRAHALRFRMNVGDSVYVQGAMNFYGEIVKFKGRKVVVHPRGALLHVTETVNAEDVSEDLRALMEARQGKEATT